jgi:DNA-binding cell septation regulator SpoVG
MSQVFSNWRIFPLTTKVGSLLANGKVTVSGTVDVSFTLVDGPKGIFAALPSKKSGKKDEKTGKDIYYPDVKILDEATQSTFQEEAVAEWNAKTSGVTESTPKSSKNVPF